MLSIMTIKIFRYYDKIRNAKNNYLTITLRMRRVDELFLK